MLAAQGFELGIYSQREYLMIYWYLEYVSSSWLDNMTMGARSLETGYKSVSPPYPEAPLGGPPGPDKVRPPVANQPYRIPQTRTRGGDNRRVA